MENNMFSFKEALKRGWNLLNQNFWFLIGVTIFPSVIGFLFSFIINIPLIRDSFFLAGLIQILSIVVSLIFNISTTKILLKIVDGQSASWEDFFSLHGINSSQGLFYKYAIINAVYFFIVLVGLILFIIPGIILGIKYGFAPYLVVDKHMGILEALKTSGTMTQGYKWQLFLFGIVCVLVALLGLLVLIIGIIPASIVISIASVHVYRLLAKKLPSTHHPVAEHKTA